jgi:hypothetical protein
VTAVEWEQRCSLIEAPIRTDKWDEQVLRVGETVSHEEASAAPHRGSPRRQHKVEMTIGTYFVIYRRFEETQGRRF